jgi:hypothetical protein
MPIPEPSTWVLIFLGIAFIIISKNIRSQVGLKSVSKTVV